jgi:hypothetical protein
MSLMTISGSGAVTRVEAFPLDTEHNIEGNAMVHLSVEASCPGPISTHVAEAYEWWCAAGGWVRMIWDNSSTFYGLGPDLPPGGPHTRSWDVPQYDPVEHVVLQVRATDPTGVHQPEWIFTQFGLGANSGTVWSNAVESAPSTFASPIPLLPIGTPRPGLQDAVFIAVMAPVDIVDLVVPDGKGLRAERTLLLTGQIVNWLKDATILHALKARDASTHFRVQVTEATTNTVVLNEDLFHGASAFPPFEFLTGGDGDNRVASFILSRPLPSTFTRGRLDLLLTIQGVTYKREVSVQLAAVDVLHRPFQMPDDPNLWAKFGNGVGENTFNGHTRDTHQRYAIDLGVATLDGKTTPLHAPPGDLSSYYDFRIPVLSVADGIVRAVFDDTEDHVKGGGKTNRVFIEHMHAGGPRYSVYAHIAQKSAADAGGFHLTSVQRFVDNGQAKFLGVFHPGSGGQLLTVGEDFAAFGKDVADRLKEGFHLTSVQRFVENGQAKFLGVFHPGSGGQLLTVGEDFAAFGKDVADRLKQGFHLTSVQRFVDNGQDD